MKEKEFDENVEKELVIPVYYGVDKEGNVILDEDSMMEEFDNKFEEIRRILDLDDLQVLVSNKINKIKKKR